MKIIVKRSFFKNGRVYKRGDEIELPNAEALVKNGLVEIIKEEVEVKEEVAETEVIEKPEKKVKKKTSTKKKKVEE